ncbi:MAG: squalene/phytoene synthase family protein [Geminicoccaceae bacterium]
MDQKAVDQLSPLAADIKLHSPDRYLATLFAPPARRGALIALYAFDHEMERIQTVVREPMAGLIRLQWWQDVIDDIEHGATVAHPVVQALRGLIIDDGLDPAFLSRAIDGRRRRFEDEQPSSVSSYQRHLLEIGGSITSAAAALLGICDRETMAAADRIGTAVAAWEQYRLLATAKRDDMVWQPQAWLQGSSDEAAGAANADARMHLAALASAELAEARRQNPPIARAALSALFPGTLVGIRLGDRARLIRQPTVPTAVPRLFWHWLRGRF